MAVESHDKKLDDLLNMVETGKAQLPDFQRSWVWDDTKICKLIESITSGYPMGAAMFLAFGGEHFRFKYRMFEGVVPHTNETPEWLVLDGQQRLTTLYQVLKSKNATLTRLETSRDITTKRFYYLNIRKCLDTNADRLEAIVSVSEKRQLTTNIGREIILDLSTREKEFENLMFPLNITFSTPDIMKWMMDLHSYYNNDSSVIALFQEFYTKVLMSVQAYTMPIIQLDKETPKEAVCQIFENVNTGGVPLTVFELVTATFAADGQELREDWKIVKETFKKKSNGELLNDITGVSYLSAITLLSTYCRKIATKDDERMAVSCKKRDILRLTLEDYKLYKDSIIKGFCEAADFLVHQGIYRSRDLPYSTQLVPLAAIFAYDDTHEHLLALGQNQKLLSQWYWCGVMGELYGGANEARFALDIQGVFRWMKCGEIPDTVYRSNLQPTRLLTMQTRNSAAYKGVMALITKESPLDFMTGNKMDVAAYIDEEADIHHIFPQAYCEKLGLPKAKWNSVINKTPIYASSNRSIGGHAPSVYIGTMANKGLSVEMIKESIESHQINYNYLNSDDFNAYFIDRTKRLLKLIEKATGKSVSGLESEDTIREFGEALV